MRGARFVPRRIRAALRGAVRSAEPTLPTLPNAVPALSSTPAVLSAERALGLPYLADVAVVSDADAVDLAFPDFAPRHTGGELPVPPAERWTVAEDFLGSGRRDAERMVELVASAGLGLGAGTKVLDFGCGPGRVLRWLPQHIDGWGIDLDADRIAWCQEALSPPFRFATCSTSPHLPFRDDTFDLIYAGSVFTHLAELADAWLLELLRITAPGGILYLTIHDQATVAFCRQKDSQSLSRALTGYAQSPESEARFRSWGDRLGVDLDGFTLGRGYFAQVFYDRDAIRRHWGRYAEVVDVVPEAFALHQTAVVLRRRADDSDWRG